MTLLPEPFFDFRTFSIQKVQAMKFSFLCLLLFLTNFNIHLNSQEVIDLPINLNDVDIEWPADEKQYHSKIWDTEVVTNVVKPTMMVYHPAENRSNGTSVIICPGGGLYALSIQSEGIQVAEWLAKKGVTSFVLKYRLVPTGEDGTMDLNTDGPNVINKVKRVLPMSVSDAFNAIEHVRSNAEKYNIDPTKIGLMGFSAGGAVTMAATYTCTGDQCPDYIAPVYAWMDVVGEHDVPVGAPPIFVVCASDDPLRLAPGSVQLYSDWLEAGKEAEMHMFAKGGHGFGMRTQNLPSDKWIEYFAAWLDGKGWLALNSDPQTSNSQH